jgi:hypothetical protein
VPSDVELLEFGDDPESGTSWREAPRKAVADMADDPLQLLILAQAREFNDVVHEYLDRARGPALYDSDRRKFLDYAMYVPSHLLKISEHIHKYKARGRQEVIVKHETMEVGRGLRGRTSRLGRRSAMSGQNKTVA